MLDQPAPGTAPERADIVVDAMGGDHGPAQVVAGAAAAAATLRAPVILTGRPAELRTLVAAHQDVAGLLRVISAEDAIGMDEGALASWRRPRSSVAIACQLVRRGQAAAVVSAGSTGGIVATARLRLRSVPGLLRPALAVVLPTRPTPTVLVDAGAIADPKPETLLQFAHLGVAYAQVAHGIAEPTVGLLSIGEEPGKGNKLIRRAHELLAAPPPHGALPIRFAGNVEGSDLMAGRVNVIVADGFTGNVALKTLEGATRFAGQQLRAVLQDSRAARIGALLQRRGLRELRGRLDSETYGGAALLGLEGTIVIAHGASTARGITSACLLAAELVRGQITEKIRERLGHGRHFLRRS
jgi:phosphate acyltransferase